MLGDSHCSKPMMIIGITIIIKGIFYTSLKWCRICVSKHRVYNTLYYNTQYNYIIIIISSVYVYFYIESCVYDVFGLTNEFRIWFDSTLQHPLWLYMYNMCRTHILLLLLILTISSDPFESTETRKKIVPRAQLSRLSYEFYNFLTCVCVRVCTGWSI